MAQFGNGLTTDSATPVAVNVAGVLAGRSVTAISIGSVARNRRLRDRRLHAPTAGARTPTVRSVTAPPPTGSHRFRFRRLGRSATQAVTSISVGGYSTCAVAGGKAYCWGLNEFGELGNNTVVNQTAPVAVDSTGVLAGKVITAISTGAQITGNTQHPAFGHTCAVAGGAPVCWGANQYGQLGATTTSYQSSVPVAVSTADALLGRTVVRCLRRRCFQPDGDRPARGPEHSRGLRSPLAPVSDYGHPDRISVRPVRSGAGRRSRCRCWVRVVFRPPACPRWW